MFYASGTVLPAEFHDTRSCLLLVDVSHRNNDRETGELCRHEGRHRHFPAAPSASPLQLPIAAAHAIRPHPAQGQGAVHLQVRARRPAGAGPYPRLGSAALGERRPRWDAAPDTSRQQSSFTRTSSVSRRGWEGDREAAGLEQSVLMTNSL